MLCALRPALLPDAGFLHRGLFLGLGLLGGLLKDEQMHRREDARLAASHQRGRHLRLQGVSNVPIHLR